MAIRLQQMHRALVHQPIALLPLAIGADFVEILVAHLKRILRLDKLRLRGFSGARDELLLAATAQNLRRMAKWLMPMAGKVEMVIS